MLGLRLTCRTTEVAAGQLFRRLVVDRGAGRPAPTFRAGTAVRAPFVGVPFVARVTRVPVFTLAVVFFEVPALAVFAFTAFALALDVLVALMFLDIREA